MKGLKKIGLFIIASLLVASVAMPVSAEQFSESESELLPISDFEPEVVEEDPVDLFIESLPSTLAAGQYIDDSGKLILGVTDIAAAEDRMRAAGIGQDQLLLTEVEFSFADLEYARDVLYDNGRDYAIEAVGLDASINGLAVFTSDMSEKNTEDITAIATANAAPQSRSANSTKSIDIVIYGSDILDGVSDIDYDYAETAEEQVMSTAASTVRAGEWLGRSSSTNWSSVGWAAKVNGSYGFLTCGHGWERNSSVYHNGSQIGTISHRGYNGSTDYSFFARATSWGGPRGGAAKVSSVGSPAINSNVFFDGAKHYGNNLGRENTKVIATNITLTFNSILCTGMFVLDGPSYVGDSGAAIIEKRGDGTYRFIGLVKGAATNAGSGRLQAFGVTWTSIRDHIGSSSIQIVA